MSSLYLLGFIVDEQRYALKLAKVQQVVRIVEIANLPKAPEIVLGLINFQGSVIPVLDVRKRFGLAARDLSLSDQLVIADTRTLVYVGLFRLLSSIRPHPINPPATTRLRHPE
jgi:purine-binding chemotaxis protein CheW